MPTAANAPRARRQIALLVACQALLYVNNVALVAVSGLAGLVLAPAPLWATVPVTAYIVGAALATMPASLAMGRWGRRAGFMFGAAMGAAGAVLCAAAMLAGSFAGLCAGSFTIGIYNAFAQYLRFAAADVADAYDGSMRGAPFRGCSRAALPAASSVRNCRSSRAMRWPRPTPVPSLRSR